MATPPASAARQKAPGKAHVNIIYPLGTEQDPSGYKTVELMKHPDAHIIDCRLDPWSWRSIWQKPTLTRLYGKRYHPAGKFLGNAKHPSNQMLPGKCEIEIACPEVGIRGLITYLEEGRDLILIDHYLEMQYSHLNEIIRLLQEQRPDVRILLPETSPPQEEYTYTFSPGTKVTARVRGQQVPAIVLDCRWSHEGDYELTRLRIAVWSELEQTWWVSEYDKPVQSYKLRRRHDHIVALDEPHMEK